ncbi:MAG: electron transport complex subunit RsxC [Clostridia bacterium]|nr:electron transport complex subunit RsxC [Clostridia bacterium]
MAFFLNSIPVPLKKNTADKPSVRMTDVKTVMIPMLMHQGTPATPVVKMGDLVKVGTKIAQANGELSSPIYASVSGKVTKVCDYLTASGKYVPAIVITADGEMATEEGLTAPTVNSKDELLAAIRESGVVGLGGAGFPTHVKLNVDFENVETLIVNGTECEPYITSDNHVMNERAGDIEFALSAFKKHLGIKHIVIGVGNNKKTSIENMKELASRIEGAEVIALPSTYSHGSEEAIVFHATKKVLPQGKLPVDIGCVVCNVTTIAEIGKYLKTGMPFVERYVTVDGSCVKEPQCVIAPIGVSLEELFAFVGEFECDPERVVYGGPMMGITVPSLSAPVLKTTNSVLALSEKETKFPKETACIRCGRCTNNCPLGIAPAAIEKAYARKDVEELVALQVTACMECGSCAYLCPAHRPLVQTNKLAKALVKEANN